MWIHAEYKELINIKDFKLRIGKNPQEWLSYIGGYLQGFVLC